MDTATNVDKGILEKGVTEKSTADYVCFHVHESKSLAAVLLETKMQKAFKMNSIAQFVGYYLRSPSISIQPAVCTVMTEATLHIILFPFLDQYGSSLVNPVLLKPIHYKKLPAALSLLAVVTHKDFHYTTYLLGYQQFPKGYQFMLTSRLDESIQ